MSKVTNDFDSMSLDRFEHLLADMPHDQRWELIGGRFIKETAGVCWEHNTLSQNIALGLRRQLRARRAPCHVFLETFYMKNKSVESATLPDVMISCGALTPAATSVDDPIIVIEVMSRGSAARDRDEKWRVYRRLASLKHYVLVERDHPSVEVFDRTGDAWASMRSLDGLDAVLDLPALGLSMSLREIYEDVLTP